MATKKSNYDGYIGKTPQRRKESAAEAMGSDYEGIKTNYETYKRKSEPDAKTTQSQMRKGSESAAGRVDRTGREADNERTRELRRASRDGDLSQYRRSETGRPPMSKKWIEK